MAIEWYLMKDQNLGGVESDEFTEGAEGAFEDIANSALGEDVEICNYDLTIRKPVRVVVQGAVADTRLNALQRKILAPIGTMKAGQYVYYKKRYWLIIGIVDDNHFYEKGVAMICNYQLSWLNGQGKPVQRWVNATSASQYNNGETSTVNMYYRSDQLIVLAPQDDECLLIPHGQRIVLDIKTKIYEKSFPKDVVCDTSKPLITYFVSRLDNVLFNYGDSGHMQFMATQDDQHESDGYYVIDGKGYWLCDVPKKDDKSTVLSCSIEGEENVVYNGIEPSIFTAKFLNAKGEEVDVSPTWIIDAPFKDKLEIEEVENSISIAVNDKKLLNKFFTLSLSAEGYETASITIKIEAFI